MTNVGTIVAGYGITIVAIAFYAAWIINRGRAIGEELGIGSSDESSGHDEATPWT